MQEIISKFLSKKITKIEVSGDSLEIKFDDSTGLKLYDDGQSCCENRYMNCDDKLDFFEGANFAGVELGDSSEKGDDDYGVTEIQFLKVYTTKGSFTVANYNEHNGYYGGFYIRAEELK